MLYISFDIEQSKCKFRGKYSNKSVIPFVAWKKDRDNGNWLFKTMKKKLHFTNYGVCGLFSINEKNVWTVLLVTIILVWGQSYVLNETANAFKIKFITNAGGISYRIILHCIRYHGMLIKSIQPWRYTYLANLANLRHIHFQRSIFSYN
jgi:hypothetical protein